MNQDETSFGADDVPSFDPVDYGLPVGSPPPPAFCVEAPPARWKRVAQGLAAALVSLAMLCAAIYMLELFRDSSTSSYAPRFAPPPAKR